VIPLNAWITALEAAMMGRRCGEQARFFYQFRLDERNRPSSSGDLISTHIFGTDVPVEEPSTASETDIEMAQNLGSGLTT
jgi:hypothetical protein